MDQQLQMICSIEGCAKTARRRGMCGMHHSRLLVHGSPHKLIGTPNGAAQEYLNISIPDWKSDECMTWPFARLKNGYGRIRIGAKNYLTHRVVCERVNGPAPSSRHYAAHTCGKGHDGCVNPQHLIWKTPKENAADKIIHDTHNRGTRHYRSKLTELDVSKIRASAETASAISRQFNISRSHASAIKRGDGWDWV